MTAIRRATVIRGESMSHAAAHNSAAVSLSAEPWPYVPPDRSDRLPPPIRGARKWDSDPVIRHADRATERGVWK